MANVARVTVTSWLRKFGCAVYGSSRSRYIARAVTIEKDSVTGRYTVSVFEPDPRKPRGRTKNKKGGV